MFAVLTCNSIPSGSSTTEQSGDGQGTTYLNDSCRIPIYSQQSYEVNATDKNIRLLITEGRCFLSCLRYYSSLNREVSIIYIYRNISLLINHFVVITGYIILLPQH